MNEAILVKSVIVFLSLWALGLVLLWFRQRIEIIWKIIATLIFAFYVYLFFDEINKGIDAFSKDFIGAFGFFIKEFFALVYVNMFLIWPLGLLLIFYKADPIASERLLKFLSIFTVVLWIAFTVYLFFNKGIDSFFMKHVRELLS